MSKNKIKKREKGGGIVAAMWSNGLLTKYYSRPSTWSQWGTLIDWLLCCCSINLTVVNNLVCSVKTNIMNLTYWLKYARMGWPLSIRENPPVFLCLTGAWNLDYPRLLEIWHDVYKFLWSHMSLIYRNLTINVQRFWHNSCHNVTGVTLLCNFGQFTC